MVLSLDPVVVMKIKVTAYRIDREKSDTLAANPKPSKTPNDKKSSNPVPKQKQPNIVKSGIKRMRARKETQTHRGSNSKGE